MELPLRDFVVLDLSQIIAGPETAMLLGDLGANVIKIEKPGGDDSRYMGIHRQNEPMTLTYSVLNRNKRSIVLDITTPEGLDVLYRLVKQADILVEAFVPGMTERLRIDYETLKELNPRLIYASISGFGTQGPYASKPAYDLVVQGFSGVMAARRWPDGTPIPAPFWVGDASAPFIIGFGIMLAAWSRERTGVGQKVATSLLQAHIAMQSTQLVKAKLDADTESTGSAAFMPYPCGDGEYLNVTILNERQWQAFCSVLEVDYLGTDAAYNSVAKRSGKPELYELISGVLATRPMREWLDLIQAAGVPCGPVLTRAQVYSEPQIVENNMLIERDQPGIGPVVEMGFPIEFSTFESSVRRSAPRLGEHTESVLADFGFAAEEIERLRADAVIH